jgi:hypothetical protein
VTRLRKRINLQQMRVTRLRKRINLQQMRVTRLRKRAKRPIEIIFPNRSPS